MKYKNLSVKKMFGWVALGLILSMSGITIAMFLVTKTDDSSADRWGIAAVCICRNFRIDAGVWKAAVAVYR